ncbi:hypothetical protein EVAR_83242_1 [Eumeta japonica]|uniref:Uncharacterized protein n=1 Tax=Eumeta variegata TaxID=151549 RepID=A0A4C1Y4K8_EUMVA|nr:hypothetical protein EVAR_83242_1 [Eumeta japonica]
MEDRTRIVVSFYAPPDYGYVTRRMALGVRGAVCRRPARAQRTSESGLHATPLLSVSLGRTPRPAGSLQ